MRSKSIDSTVRIYYKAMRFPKIVALPRGMVSTLLYTGIKDEEPRR
jgi:hypothetical protein